MNRVIKFRAWDSFRKKMFTNPEWVSFHVDFEGQLTAYNHHPKGHKQQLEVMQFTGLHDANGVEIYEGDIVASPHFTDAAGRKHILKHLVEWSDKYLGWFLANATSADGTGSIQMFIAQRAELEVIGNIYKNPELLKE